MNRVGAQLTADAAVRQLLSFDYGVNGADTNVQKMRDFFDGQKIGKSNYRRSCRGILFRHEIPTIVELVRMALRLPVRSCYGALVTVAANFVGCCLASLPQPTSAARW